MRSAGHRLDGKRSIQPILSAVHTHERSKGVVLPAVTEAPQPRATRADSRANGLRSRDDGARDSR